MNPTGYAFVKPVHTACMLELMQYGQVVDRPAHSLDRMGRQAIEAGERKEEATGIWRMKVSDSRSASHQIQSHRTAS